MARFNVTIKETLKLSVEVEADSFDEALNTVIDEYQAGKHVLTADNYVDTEFDATEIGGLYRVLKHYEDDMELVFETSELLTALRTCIEEPLCRESGHAISVHNTEGSIFEINYHGSKEVNIDNCATDEEFETIMAFFKNNF